MSLILEALRKSEAERRRGQVPDLHTEPAPGVQPLRAGRPAWLWPALALTTALVLVIALWLSRSAPPQPSHAVDVPVVAAGPAADRPVDSDDDAGPGVEPIGAVGSSGMPDDHASAGAAPALMPPPRGQPDVARIPDAASAAAASTTPVPASASAKAVGPAADPAAAAPAPAPAPARPPPAPAVAATPARTAVPDAVLSNGASALPAAPGSAPLRLSDLTVAQRKQLPPLKVSMHMYSPTQRFAIIDGSRVAEGDRIGDAVVEEITANGVVLDWQGQRLQIPIR